MLFHARNKAKMSVFPPTDSVMFRNEIVWGSRPGLYWHEDFGCFNLANDLITARKAPTVVTARTISLYQGVDETG